MTRARWWDGCDRAVVARTSFAAIGSGKSIWLLHLECGHSQPAAPGTNQHAAAICRECAQLEPTRQQEVQP